MIKEKVHSQLSQIVNHYQWRNDRFKKNLKGALHTSSSEFTILLKKLIKTRSPKVAIALVTSFASSSAWVSHSILRLVYSHVNLTINDLTHSISDKDGDILNAIEKKNSIFDKYTHEEVFETIYNDCELKHYYPKHESILKVPKTNCTLVLVSGVFNEIFSTAAFERGAKHLFEKHSIKYYIAGVKGTKCSSFNSDVLKEELTDYISKRPNEKLWLVGHSKGGIDCLHFLQKNPSFSNSHIIGLSTIASPILGSDHVHNKAIELLNRIHNFNDNPLYQFIDKRKDILAKGLQKSLSSTHQRVWFRNNHKSLPKNPFYTSVAFKSKWYESHLWMIFAKLIFKSKSENDGIVDAENALFPNYFNGIRLGIHKGHHLIGTRSSFYCQEALLEAHLIFLDYLNLIK